MQNSSKLQIPPVILTKHARLRLAQRNLTEALLTGAETFGRRGSYQPGGVEVWRVDHGIVRSWQREHPSIVGLLGVTLVNGANGACVTAYKNRKCQRLLRKAVRPGRGRYRNCKVVKP
jgi:hypothetical protein